MYTQYFGLNEYPFSLTPDTQFFSQQKSHQEALNTLFFALKSGQGFIKVVGEVGTGKTLLCRILLSHLSKEQFVTAFIPNPWLTPEELKILIAQEIGAEFDKSMLSHELTSSIYRKLMQLARQDKQVVILMDEAQAMPRDTLEALRLLTNLETEKSKLVQVVMFGQPELDELLKRNDLRQLAQRIVFAEYLKPLSIKEVGEYVQYRVKTSGCERAMFSASATWLLTLSSGGIPRLVNVLAHKALLCAYGKGDYQVGGWHIAKAVADTQEVKGLGKFLSLFWRVNGRLFLSRSLEVGR